MATTVRSSGSMDYLSAEAARNRSLIVTLGILQVIIGVLCVLFSGFTTLVSMIYLGITLCLGGVLHMIYAYQTRKGVEGNLWFNIALGMLYLLLGVFVFRYPIENAMAISMLIAFLMIGFGLSRIVLSVIDRGPNWGLSLLNGCLSTLMGLIIFYQWPISGLWVIGLFVGVEIMLSGFYMLRLGVRSKAPTT